MIEADGDTVIIARTDARASEGFDAAVERAKRYLDASGLDFSQSAHNAG